MGERKLVSHWYVEDTFDDIDGTILPAHTPDVDALAGGWTDVVAGADIVGIGNYLTDNSAARQAVIDVGQSDVDIRARMRIAGGGSSETGLIFRYQDASNYMWAGMGQLWHRPVLYEVVGGTPVELGLAANSSLIIANDTTVTMRITAVGTQLRLYVQDILRVSPVTSRFQTETECGIRSNHAGAECRWFDFRVGRVLL